MPESTTRSATREQQFRLRPPARALRWLELRALLEAWSLLPFAPMLLAQPRGDGRQVLLIPGYLADDASTKPLRSYLSYLNYEALPWTLGRNTGHPQQDALRLRDHLASVQRKGEPITLIGWSLGGVIAREVARLDPNGVREVITLGTPIEGGPKYTITRDRYAGKQNLDLDQFEEYIHQVNKQGIRQKLTVVYSRSDAIVGWRAAIDRYNPQARHVRVFGSHLGLGVNPRVWRIIARTLHQSGQ